MEEEEEEEVVVIAGTNYLFDNDTILSPSLLNLRIRNTIEYLKWGIVILIVIISDARYALQATRIPSLSDLRCIMPKHSMISARRTI
jgi:hypothetical protein